MTPPDSQKTIQKKVVVAACFGTFLEWYDFLTFASLAVYFSVLFFPADDPVAALLASHGVGPGTAVVAYDDSRLAFASRLWWHLVCSWWRSLQWDLCSWNQRTGNVHIHSYRHRTMFERKYNC